MSRCFQYPPPGYTLSRAHYEALIEAIKLQKEKERKEEKKAKRKEKKEKRKAKKERRKVRKEKKERKEREKVKKDETDQNLGKPDIAKRHVSEKSLSETKVEFLHNKREAENEQPEQSGLTEEHAGPTGSSGPSSSPDSTHNSNKRKRHSSTMDDTRGHGEVTLIRLSSKKQTEFDALSDEQLQQPCSTSGRSVSAAKRRNVNCVRDWPEKLLRGTEDINQQLNLRNNGERQQICSTSGQVEAGKTGTKCTAEEILSEMWKMEFLQYENLLEKCLAPQIQDLCIYRDDLDWLLQGKNREKRRRFERDGSSCAISAGSWPRMVYLREVDAYALPFTVPY